jgi:hypothetical protein
VSELKHASLIGLLFVLASSLLCLYALPNHLAAYLLIPGSIVLVKVGWIRNELDSVHKDGYVWFLVISDIVNFIVFTGFCYAILHLISLIKASEPRRPNR